MASRIAGGVLFGSLGFAALNQWFLFNVDGGQRGLIFDKLRGGIQDKVRGEGTHFYIPVLQRPILYDVKITPRDIQTETGTKDLQNVRVILRVLYHPDTAQLKFIHKSYGQVYADTVLPAIGNEVLKSVIAQFDAGELITQREQVSALISKDLRARAQKYSIEFSDVSLTHLEFGKDYMKAVEHKQVAQQYAERQRFLVEKATQETEAEVILAEGETEAAELIMESMAMGNEFIELRKIEAARVIAKSLAYSPNVSYVPASGNLLLNLPSASGRRDNIRPAQE